MAKNKSFYLCSSCGYGTPKWLGQCPSCKNWSTFENSASESLKQTVYNKISSSEVPLFKLNQIETCQINRVKSNLSEWDRVLGGGIVPGSFIVLTGDPGIGKSTLLLQISNLISQDKTVFYFSSEESVSQIKIRAERLGCKSENIFFSDEADLELIISTSLIKKPDILIIDSVQNCFLSSSEYSPGSINQIKESAFKLMRFAKENCISVVLTGHVTKEGNIAGPRLLEHMVDAVFYLQGEERFNTRVLRSVKNRFGCTNEIGFFKMGESGLEEVRDINSEFISQASNAPGSSLISFLEGSKPIIVDVQALVLASKYPTAQRIISGVDYNQVVLIASILEKYLQVKLSACDIFIKVSGGFKVKSSGIDLGIALALLSSYFQKPLTEKSLSLGELALTGFIKPVNNFDLFLKEAKKFGISTFFISRGQQAELQSKFIRFKNVYELLSIFD